MSSLQWIEGDSKKELQNYHRKLFWNVKAAKNLFSSVCVCVIGTTYFDKYVLFHVITGRYYFS